MASELQASSVKGGYSNDDRQHDDGQNMMTKCKTHMTANGC